MEASPRACARALIMGLDGWRSSSSSICRACASLLASLTAEPLFHLSHPEMGPRLVGQDLLLDRDPRSFSQTSISIALCVTVIAVRHRASSARWLSPATTGRAARSIRSIVLLPIFFPQSVLGLAPAPLVQRARAPALVEDRGLRPSGLDRAGGDPGHLDPGLLRSTRRSKRRPSISARSRWQVLREVTLPVLLPGIFSGCLLRVPPVLGQFPLSLFTTGADTTVRNISMPRPGYAGRAGSRHDLALGVVV